MTDNIIDTPSDVAIFLNAGAEIERSLIILSAPESLTDDLAKYLLEHLETNVIQTLVEALHLCDFVIERNREWNLAPRARQYLQEQLIQHPNLMDATHGLLFELTNSSDVQAKLPEIPLYLTAGTGRAYHLAFIDVQEGLAEYSRIALKELSGQQWLATKLAREQQDLRVLPKDVFELDFLQGMVYYREGRIRDAIELLRRVADAPLARLEVAIAAHLVGRFDGRQRRTRTAEKLLDRSLEINEALKNETGEAQVLHTLGQLIGRNRRRAAEAEELLRRSLAMEQKLNRRDGEAQVLHTLGQLIGRNQRRAAEAEELLRRSLAIRQELGDRSGEAHVLHTLGQLIGRNRRRAAEAEELLRRSLAIEQELGDRSGEAQVLHTLGQLIGRNQQRTPEAEELLRRSLNLGEPLGRLHQAQVLYTWGRILSTSDRDKAVQLLERSLALNQQLRYGAGIAIVRRQLRQLNSHDHES